MEASLKVSRALTRLVCTDPFFGSCALRLDVHEDKSIGTAATNGAYIMWNKDFVDMCTEEEVVGVLCHEVLHVLFEHCNDLEGRDHMMANIAMDLVINDVILNDTKYLLPKGAIQPEARFNGMTWKQVYAIIIDEEKYQKMAKDPTLQDLLDHISENGDLSDAEKKELSDTIKEMATLAAEVAEKGQGHVPGAVKELINEIRTPTVNWKDVLEATVKGGVPDDYTWRKPNRKMLGYDLYMPTSEAHGVGNIVVGLDTSGSVTKDELTAFLAELNGISQTCSFESIIILYNDAGVAHTQTFYPGDNITELEVKGRGGTCFKPVFEYVEKMALEVDQMIYFSDMEVSDDNFPKLRPYYPVLWISTHRRYKVPFGNLIKIA